MDGFKYTVCDSLDHTYGFCEGLLICLFVCVYVCLVSFPGFLLNFGIFWGMEVVSRVDESSKGTMSYVGSRCMMLNPQIVNKKDKNVNNHQK